MKRIITTGLCWAMVMGVTGLFPAHAEEKAFEGTVSVGGSLTTDDIDNNEDGAKGAEYNSTADKNSALDLGAEFSVRGELFNLDADAHYQDGDDHEYSGRFDINRMFIYKGDYSSFLHRLGHDTLDNLEAHIFSNTTDGAGVGYYYDFNSNGVNDKNEEVVGSAAVYHTDFNIDDEYAIVRTEMNNSAMIHLPNLPMLTIGFDHRYEKREGMEQSRTMSKCSSCHVVATSKDIHEETNDYVPKVAFRMGSMAVDYSFLHREFHDQSEDMFLTYNALAASHAAFTNRLQFDNNTGSLPFDRTPSSTKDTHTAKARWNIDPQNIVTGAFVYSTSTNKEVDAPLNQLAGNFGDELKLDSTTIMAKWHSKVSRALSFNVSGKYQTLRNDDVYVDVNDRLNPAGAPGGAITLADGYGLVPGVYDYNRESGSDLDITTLGLKATWRPMHGVTTHGAYEYKNEERKNAAAHDVTEETTEHTFKLSGDWRATRSFKLGLGYKLGLTEHPYALEHAMCVSDSSFGDYGGPPADLYDYLRSYEPTIYSQRQAGRTNQPKTANEFKFKANWTPKEDLSATLHAKYLMADNDEVNGDKWQQNQVTSGLDVTLTPSDKLVLAAGYNYFYDEYDSMYCIALYDG